MFYKTFANSFGLILDIIGAYLIFKYGLPEKIDREGHNQVVAGGIDEEEIQKAKKYDFWANWGILCLMTGFILQLISNYLSE